MASRNGVTTIEIELDEQILERARGMAMLRHSTLEAFIREIIQLLAQTEATDDPILGMFAQEPELIDQIVEATMTAREVHPLRLLNG